MIWSYAGQCKPSLVLEVLFHLIIYLKKKKTTKVCFYRLFLISSSYLRGRQGLEFGSALAWEKAYHRLNDVSLPTRKEEELVCIPTSPFLSMTLGRTGSVWGISWMHLQITFWGDGLRGGQLANRSTYGLSLASWRGVGSTPCTFVNSQILLLWTRKTTSLLSNPPSWVFCMQTEGSLRTINLYQGLAKQWEEGLLPLLSY